MIKMYDVGNIKEQSKWGKNEIKTIIIIIIIFDLLKYYILI